MALTQSHFRFGTEDGTESTHGWHAAEDTNPSQDTIANDTTFFLRFCIQANATGQTNVDAEFQYRRNGGTWTNITTTSSVVKAVTTAVFANAANTTKRLSGTGTFESSSQGCTHDGIAGGAQMDIVASGNAETMCSLQIVSADVANNDVIDFRLTRDGGTLLDTYAVTPSITVSVSATPTRGRFSFTAFETPLVATRGRASWLEFEAPLVGTRGRLSQTEFEVPIAATRGRSSWTEFEVPSIGPEPTRGRVSWAEFQTDFVLTRGRASWAELEVPGVATRGRLSFIAFQVPLVGDAGYSKRCLRSRNRGRARLWWIVVTSLIGRHQWL